MEEEIHVLTRDDIPEVRKITSGFYDLVVDFNTNK